MVWLALYACMLQAQTVNLFDESSIGMGDSIDQVKYQVVYDAEYIYERNIPRPTPSLAVLKRNALADWQQVFRILQLSDIPKRLYHLCEYGKGIPANFPVMADRLIGNI